MFGSDHVLAYEEGSLPVFAYLPAAVRAFFANGGRRCHVVRVAGRRAKPTRFAVPGLIAVSSAGDPTLATVDAASVGAWANGATLSSRLDALPMPPRSMASERGSVTWRDGGSSAALQPGDVLRLWVDGGGTWLAAIAGVAPLPSSPDAGPSRDLRIEISAAWELGVDAGGAPGSPRIVSRLSTAAATPIGVATGLCDTTAGSAFEIQLEPGADDPQPGDVLVLDPIGPAPGARSLVVSVSSTLPMPVASPPDRRFQVDGHRALVLEAESLPVVAQGGFIRVERMRFELRLHAGAAGDVLVSDLAFGAGGPRPGSTSSFRSRRSCPVARHRRPLPHRSPLPSRPIGPAGGRAISASRHWTASPSRRCWLPRHPLPT